MADVEFFFDPVCPWAWMTSRFTVEVARLRDLSVDWKFICLSMVNEEKEMPEAARQVHEAGRSMLRIAAAARQESGNEAVGRLYTELGTRLHNEGRSRSEIREGVFDLIGEAVAAAGLPSGLEDAADDAGRDATVRAETELALGRTGPDVGTPILTFDPGTADEASIFGPVISRLPRGEDALRLWDATVLLARAPAFYELKRTNRERPDFS